MGTGFHDLEVWRGAKHLAVATYRATNGIRDFSLRDQIRRAAISVPSNIAEGDEPDSDKEGVRFFYIAKGSLAELRTQIEIGVEVGLISTQEAGPLLTAAATLARRLGALIKSRTHVS